MLHGTSDLTASLISPKSSARGDSLVVPVAPADPKADDELIVIKKTPSRMFIYGYRLLRYINTLGDTNNGAIAGVELQMLFSYMFGFVPSPMAIPHTPAALVPFNGIWMALAAAYYYDNRHKSLTLTDVDPTRPLDATLETVAEAAATSSTTPTSTDLRTANIPLAPRQTQAETYDNMEAFAASRSYDDFSKRATINVTAHLEVFERDHLFVRLMLKSSTLLAVINAIGASVFGLAALDNVGINWGKFMEFHTIKNELIAAACGAFFQFAKLLSGKAVAKATTTATIPESGLTIPRWTTTEKIDLLAKYFLAVSKNSCPGLWWARVFVSLSNAVAPEFLSSELKAYGLLASACMICLIVSLPVISQGVTHRTRRRAIEAEYKRLTGDTIPTGTCNFFETMDLRKPKTYWQLFTEVLVPAALATKGIYDVSSNANAYKDLTGAPLAPIFLWLILSVFLLVHTLFYAKEKVEAGAERERNKRLVFAWYQQQNNEASAGDEAATGTEVLLRVAT